MPRRSDRVPGHGAISPLLPLTSIWAWIVPRSTDSIFFFQIGKTLDTIAAVSTSGLRLATKATLSAQTRQVN